MRKVTRNKEEGATRIEGILRRWGRYSRQFELDILQAVVDAGASQAVIDKLQERGIRP